MACKLHVLYIRRELIVPATINTSGISCSGDCNIYLKKTDNRATTVLLFDVDPVPSPVFGTGVPNEPHCSNSKAGYRAWGWREEEVWRKTNPILQLPWRNQQEMRIYGAPSINIIYNAN